MTHQTNAQRLADLLELDPSQWGGVAKVAWPAASELRRLSAIEQERDQLRDRVLALTEAADVQLRENLALRDELAALKGGQAGGEVVAWLSKNKTSGTLELSEPNEKSSNPTYWTDAFPVYTATTKPVPMTETERADMICAVAQICTGKSMRTVAATAIEWTERRYGIVEKGVKG